MLHRRQDFADVQSYISLQLNSLWGSLFQCHRRLNLFYLLFKCLPVSIDFSGQLFYPLLDLLPFRLVSLSSNCLALSERWKLSRVCRGFLQMLPQPRTGSALPSSGLREAAWLGCTGPTSPVTSMVTHTRLHRRFAAPSHTNRYLPVPSCRLDVYNSVCKINLALLVEQGKN